MFIYRVSKTVYSKADLNEVASETTTTDKFFSSRVKALDYLDRLVERNIKNSLMQFGKESTQIEECGDIELKLNNFYSVLMCEPVEEALKTYRYIDLTEIKVTKVEVR